MVKPLVTINLVVLNGQKYIRHCLDAVMDQTYDNIEVNVLDNNSQDDTAALVSNYAGVNLIRSENNLGLGGGMEKLLNYSKGKYIVALCVDVIMDREFVERSVTKMEKLDNIGALQGKIKRFYLNNGQPVKTNAIDTCGFKIFGSRRLINIGHGEIDSGQYSKGGEVFSFEGAVPVFRKRALEDSRMDGGEIYDRDYFWYADDFDLGWRMRLLGWGSYYDPSIIAYHDRQTTKSLKKSNLDFIKLRKGVPMFKRRLDWRNTRLTMLKNDSLKYLFEFVKRETALFAYFTFFEPTMYLELFNVLKLLPKMMKKRREITGKTLVNRNELAHWFKSDVYII